jgi:hypothetical protein
MLLNVVETADDWVLSTVDWLEIVLESEVDSAPVWLDSAEDRPETDD